VLILFIYLYCLWNSSLDDEVKSKQIKEIFSKDSFLLFLVVVKSLFRSIWLDEKIKYIGTLLYHTHISLSKLKILIRCCCFFIKGDDDNSYSIEIEIELNMLLFCLFVFFLLLLSNNIGIFLIKKRFVFWVYFLV